MHCRKLSTLTFNSCLFQLNLRHFFPCRIHAVNPAAVYFVLFWLVRCSRFSLFLFWFASCCFSIDWFEAKGFCCVWFSVSLPEQVDSYYDLYSRRDRGDVFDRGIRYCYCRYGNVLLSNTPPLLCRPFPLCVPWPLPLSLTALLFFFFSVSFCSFQFV